MTGEDFGAAEALPTPSKADDAHEHRGSPIPLPRARLR
jgi:hypothetical protein